jgi:hypothetical protein
VAALRQPGVADGVDASMEHMEVTRGDQSIDGIGADVDHEQLAPRYDAMLPGSERRDLAPPPLLVDFAANSAVNSPNNGHGRRIAAENARGDAERKNLRTAACPHR